MVFYFWHVSFREADEILEVKYGKRVVDQKPAAPASASAGPTVPKPSTPLKSSPSLAPPTPSATADGVSSEGETNPRTPKVSSILIKQQSLAGCSLLISSPLKSQRSENNSYSTVFMCTSPFCQFIQVIIFILASRDTMHDMRG